MRILLLGANGQVGHALRATLAPLGELVPATRDGALDDGTRCEAADFDRPDALAALVARIAPQVVVNAAAYTAVDRAEDEPDAAMRVNAAAPAAIATACAGIGALLVHYSTDYVFDGSATRPYREDDPVVPLGVYGATKLAGEQAIGASGCRHWILRTAWVYGLHGHNFLRTMLRLGAERNELRVVDDQVGTPTSARLVAEATAHALRHHAAAASGTWHLTATGATSWHGFAQEIFRQARASGHLAAAPRVVPIPTAAYPTRARRPAFSCLDTAAFRAAFGAVLPDWREDLARVLGRGGAMQ